MSLTCPCGNPVDHNQLCPYSLVVYGEDRWCNCCGDCRPVCSDDAISEADDQ